ncbi:MAG: 4Fe-4S binding protein [Candidatus Caldarchaeum sp.]|uniref:4Fe-4S binding protein n=1 Tax=Caldiarchaeum subterraneum TaxID=311458 RepID=A0A7C5L6M4_CALS0
MESRQQYRWRFDLFRIPLIKWFVRKRWFQFAVITPNLAIFFILMIAGFYGLPVGNKNVSVLVVWILWWAALMILLVPIGGRLWCMMCPMPAIGEWLQRRTLTQKNEKNLGLGKKWPKFLDNIWLQNFSFLTVSSFIGVLTTRPLATAVMLFALVIVLPTILHLLFERRVFCRYVCPVSGFIGLYSMLAPLELRVKSREVCLKHVGKECFKGSENGYGCPWYEFPQNLNRNAYCGLCMECVKTCPLDNIALNLRIGGDDLLVEPWHGIKKRGLDEAFKVFIMTTLSILYALVFVGPYGWLKDLADVMGGATFKEMWSPQGNLLLESFNVESFLLFAGLVWGSTLLAAPAVFFAFSYAAKLASGVKHIPLKKIFINFSYSLVPLSLMSWVAFSLYILLVNGSYIVAALSDPFGWGWDLFGTKHFPWTPVLTSIIPYIQAALLIAGLYLSVKLAYRIAQRTMPSRNAAIKAAIPFAAMLTGLCLLYLGLWLDSFYWGWIAW